MGRRDDVNLLTVVISGWWWCYKLCCWILSAGSLSHFTAGIYFYHLNCSSWNNICRVSVPVCCVVLCCSVCCLSSSCLCSRADDGGPRVSQPELESELLCVVAVGQRLTTLTHLLYPLLPVHSHGKRVRSSYPSMQRGRRQRNTVPFRRRGVMFSSYSCPFWHLYVFWFLETHTLRSVS